MFTIEKTEVVGLEPALRSVLNGLDRVTKSDSGICKGGDDGVGCKRCAMNGKCGHDFNHSFQLGKRDHDWMMWLAKNPGSGSEFRRLIAVYVDITATISWWAEFMPDHSPVSDEGMILSSPNRVSSKVFKRTVMLNYHLLSLIYKYYSPLRPGNNPTQNAWCELCRWIEQLPYSELITCNTLMEER